VHRLLVCPKRARLEPEGRVFDVEVMGKTLPEPTEDVWPSVPCSTTTCTDITFIPLVIART
jgi:hypothetical protein